MMPRPLPPRGPQKENRTPKSGGGLATLNPLHARQFVGAGLPGLDCDLMVLGESNVFHPGQQRVVQQHVGEAASVLVNVGYWRLV